MINEASRKDLIHKSRRSPDKSRYHKRFNYQISNFRGVDLRQLFEEDYFVMKTPINNYEVTVAFPGVLTELREVAKHTSGDATKINLQLVIKAMRLAFDKTDDVRVRCSCADFKYRFMYWAWKGDYLYGSPDPGTKDFPDKTNPKDMLGSTCKHLGLILSNKRWLMKSASTVNALIRSSPEKASVYLYNEEDLVDDEETKEVVDTETEDTYETEETSDNKEDKEDIEDPDQT